MTITAALPVVMPNRQQEPEVFVPAMDNFLSAIPEIASQIDIAIAAFNFNSINDTSTTSNTIGVGSNLTFTVSLNKSFVGGQYLIIADAAAPTTNSIIGQVFSYSSTTLVITPLFIRGSGTKTSWIISQGPSTPTLTGGGSIFHATTGNDHGSTNTKFRRLTTVVTNTATNDLTYADSATLGGSITILKSGLYYVYYKDDDPSASAVNFGISKNSSQGTTNFATITESTKWLPLSNRAATATLQGSRTGYLAAGDVLRMHTDGAMTDSQAEYTKLIIERLM